jgi:hypothetical protein
LRTLVIGSDRQNLIGSDSAVLVTRELDVRTDSDERSAIVDPGRGDPGMVVKATCGLSWKGTFLWHGFGRNNL